MVIEIMDKEKHPKVKKTGTVNDKGQRNFFQII